MKFQKSLTFTLLSVAIAITAGCTAQAETASTSVTAAPQQIAFIKNCKVIQQRAMTTDEFTAYQRLEAVEQQMEELHLPLKAFEAEMEQHSERMAELSDLVHQEDEHSIRIDKVKMAEQQKLAEEIQEITERHRPHFAALEQKGDEISDIADDFTDLLEKSAPAGGFDHIQVISDSGKTTECYDDGIKLISRN
jgi:DNA repair exonuclease SbcCD ATPase subunit